MIHSEDKGSSRTYGERAKTTAAMASGTGFFCRAIASSLFLFVLAGSSANRADAIRPNLIVIMVDDMGYAGPSIVPYGNPHYKTPGMDQLAREGVRFTDFHSSGTVCSPTRAGLLTGRYQQRAGIEAVIHPYSDHPEHPKGLRHRETTFAELLKAAGYTTGIVGKWHLGYPQDNSEFHPQNHGFDYFRGYHSGNIDYINHWGDHYEHDWWHGKQETPEEGYTTHLINQYALEFIDQNKGQPFCLYVAHESPHAPVQGPNDPIQRGPGATERSTPHEEAMKQMILEMDTGVALIRDKIIQLGLGENTLIWFFSDNGPANGTATESPRFRGRKGSVYEGGHRVPAIAWWPGKIKPDTQTDELGITLDVMPTLLSITGIQKPVDRPLDGIDLSPVLFEQKRLPRRPLFWASLSNSGNRSEAMRDGPWKLVAQHPGAKEGTFENQTVELYRLDRDLGEKTDLATRQPKIREKMRKQLNAWIEDTQQTATPQAGGWLESDMTGEESNRLFQEFRNAKQNEYDKAAKSPQASVPTFLRPLTRPASPVAPFAHGFNIENDQTLVILGATDALETSRQGYLETLLTAAYPERQLRFRNMAWQADTVYEQQRPRNFFSSEKPDYGDPDERERTQADIVFLWLGKSESLDDIEKVESFAEAYAGLITHISTYTRRIVLVTPPPFEEMTNLGLDAEKRNQSLAVYVKAIKQIGHSNKLPIVDLFEAFESDTVGENRTRNGLHLSASGHWTAAMVFANQLGFANRIPSVKRSKADSTLEPAPFEMLRQSILKKNTLWTNYWRPTNWAFLYGNRQSQPSSRDHQNTDVRWFPKELSSLVPLIDEAESTIFYLKTNPIR